MCPRYFECILITYVLYIFQVLCPLPSYNRYRGFDTHHPQNKFLAQVWVDNVHVKILGSIYGSLHSCDNLHHYNKLCVQLVFQVPFCKILPLHLLSYYTFLLSCSPNCHSKISFFDSDFDFSFPLVFYASFCSFFCLFYFPWISVDCPFFACLSFQVGCHREKSLKKSFTLSSHQVKYSGDGLVSYSCVFIKQNTWFNSKPTSKWMYSDEWKTILSGFFQRCTESANNFSAKLCRWKHST